MVAQVSYRHVTAHSKSVVLGGGRVLFPVPPEHTEEFAARIRDAMQQAEKAAYEAGVDHARQAIRTAMGVES